MQVDSFIQKLESRLDSVTDADARNRIIVEEVAGYYSLRSHEVGLFTVNQKKHEISFLMPEGMSTKGHIPLNAVNSLVSRTANELAPSLDNSFASTRHLFIFEHMLADKSNRISVQKIMSVPVISDGVANAVIQVARKGANPLEAGEDFTEQNLADLVKIAAALAQSGI